MAKSSSGSKSRSPSRSASRSSRSSSLQVSKVEVWAGDISDQPGGLARVLGPLAEAGAELECVIARRKPEQAGAGVVFLTPVKGRKVQQAARDAGLTPAADIATLRVEGPDRAGLGHRILTAVGQTGVNVRGVSAAVLGRQFVAYIGFDNAADAATAARAIRSA